MPFVWSFQFFIMRCRVAPFVQCTLVWQEGWRALHKFITIVERQIIVVGTSCSRGCNHPQTKTFDMLCRKSGLGVDDIIYDRRSKAWTKLLRLQRWELALVVLKFLMVRFCSYNIFEVVCRSVFLDVLINRKTGKNLFFSYLYSIKFLKNRVYFLYFLSDQRTYLNPSFNDLSYTLQSQ